VFSLSSNSLRCLTLITEPLSPCYILHDEAPPSRRRSAYSPSYLEEVFSEVHMQDPGY
jgi:hypothetical protein